MLESIKIISINYQTAFTLSDLMYSRRPLTHSCIKGPLPITSPVYTLQDCAEGQDSLQRLEALARPGLSSCWRVCPTLLQPSLAAAWNQNMLVTWNQRKHHHDNWKVLLEERELHALTVFVFHAEMS